MLVLALPAAAQGGAAAPSPDPEPLPATGPEYADDVDVITVTGQRREDDSQSQGIAITRFSQQELDQLGITRLSDLQANIPSLHIAQSGSATIVTLRGVGIENLNLSGEPGVLFIVDGIPIGDVGAIDGAFYDVESVRAHRGPQGTQGRKNASGGWIEVQSVPPQPDFSANFDYQYGTYDQHVSRWALNVPLAEEKLMARFSGRFEDRDGYQRAVRFFDPVNLFNFAPIRPNRSDDFNSAHDLSMRFQLRSLAVEDADIRLLGSYALRRGNAPAPHLLSQPGTSSTRTGLFDPRFPGRLARTSDDPNYNLTNLPTPQDTRTGSATLIGKREFQTDSFGRLKLELTAGFFHSDREIAFDLDATERDAQILYKQDESNQYSGELTLETVGSRPWEWKIGVFYRQEERRAFAGIHTRPIFTRRSHQAIENDSIAGFFELTYHVSEQVRLLVGGRYSLDHRFIRDIGSAVDIGLDTVPDRLGRPRRPGLIGVRGSFDAFTPKVEFQWQWRDTSHVSLSVTNGSKAGGFPLGQRCDQAVECPPYGNENVWQYQFTSKNEFFEDRLRLNLTLFLMDYDPYQVCVLGPLQTVCNIGGSATSRGIELELLAHPTPEFAINLNFNLLDARIDNYRLVDPFQPRFDFEVRPPEPNPLFGFAQDLSGNRMNKAPKYNLAVGFQYDLAAESFGLSGGGTVTPRIQYQYQSRTYYRPWNRPEFSQPRFSKVDARISWRSESARWSVEAFVDNLTDVDVINYLQVGSIGDGTVFGYYQPPRTAGIRVGMSY